MGPRQELTIDVMDRFPYLEAVVKESLRRHPPGSLFPKNAEVNLKIPRINKSGFIKMPKGKLYHIQRHSHEQEGKCRGCKNLKEALLTSGVEGKVS